MKVPFDNVAKDYDGLFTETAIGKLQRNIVHEYLDKILPANKQQTIMELNCGTGEDAVYFAKKGLNVVATDVSEEMLKITEEKINSLGLSNYISTAKLDLTNPSDYNFEQKFDLVFSNFGGLNCVDKKSLQDLSLVLSGILKDKGRIIFIVMPKFCLWETTYFLMKLKLNKVFRRASNKPVNVNLNGGDVQTFYYSPEEIANIFGIKFKVMNIKPVGFFIPPSYLNTFFVKKGKTLRILGACESSVSNFSLLAKLSDHFLIDLELKI